MDENPERKHGTSMSHPPEKKPYDPPRLTKHGDIGALTRGTAATGSDGGTIST